jgi:hypothetical protein
MVFQLSLESRSSRLTLIASFQTIPNMRTAFAAAFASAASIASNK